MDTYDRSEEAAVMMTMHSAKGLEFPVVFLVGIEEGLFPSALSIGDAAEMEEERRLCYVAITRARERLYITCAAQRMLYGRTSANLPSRFTDEIPAELLDRQGVRRREERERRSFWDEDTGAFGYSDSFRTGGIRGDSFPSGYSTRRSRPPEKKTSALRPHAPAAPPAAAPAFTTGDRVVHKSFGHGTIEKMTPMGNDALIQVKFDSGEVKKMMLRAASLYMTAEE